ncbi:hypothetical protein Ae201684_018133 [Aphanomyces euteiches]|uniref:Uncharacterized protein n=1 Tax=Aphanomyces euteiches TaxID=100861 RepID=A0A6G0W6Z3_9STRA|nr:hypothetical protein Ae201684_018133 [Aphanomyces euteiches]
MRILLLQSTQGRSPGLTLPTSLFSIESYIKKTNHVIDNLEEQQSHCRQSQLSPSSSIQLTAKLRAMLREPKRWPEAPTRHTDCLSVLQPLLFDFCLQRSNDSCVKWLKTIRFQLYHLLIQTLKLNPRGIVFASETSWVLCVFNEERFNTIATISIGGTRFRVIERFGSMEKNLPSLRACPFVLVQLQPGMLIVPHRVGVCWIVHVSFGTFEAIHLKIQVFGRALSCG